METVANRRPLQSRSSGWAGALTGLLLRTPVTPNAISLAGIGFAAAGGGAFLLARENVWWWLVGGACVQLRLVANLLDGLVAVEGGRSSPTGALYNEFPDRIEDSLLLIAAGHAAGWPLLGWAAALLAMGTAYVRALGGALGLSQDFRGPMAKQHRMALLTAGAMLSLFVPAMPWVLGVIATGTALTCTRRLMHAARTLRENGQ